MPFRLALAPYRPFFLAAALDAILGVGVWPLAAWGWISPAWMGVPLAIWHREELLAGMTPAALAGFLLTAVPRWVNSPPVATRTVRSMLGLWSAGRVLHLLVPRWSGPFASLFIGLLTWEVGRRVAASGDRRNRKIVGLLTLLTLGTILAGDHPLARPDAYGARLSLAAIVGLIIILAGRIIPAVTAARLGEERRPASWKKPSETAATMLTGLALAAWIVAPAALVTSIACASASLIHGARLVRWRGWRVAGSASLLCLHLGYGWLAVGFALVPFVPLAEGTRAPHAWTMGGMGVTCLCVMASMIRRHTGTAFAHSPLFSAAAICASLSVLARLVPLSEGPVLPALLWIAAHALFLAAFGRRLWNGSSRPPAALRQ